MQRLRRSLQAGSETNARRPRPSAIDAVSGRISGGHRDRRRAVASEITDRFRGDGDRQWRDGGWTEEHIWRRYLQPRALLGLPAEKYAVDVIAQTCIR